MSQVVGGLDHRRRRHMHLMAGGRNGESTDRCRKLAGLGPQQTSVHPRRHGKECGDECIGRGDPQLTTPSRVPGFPLNGGDTISATRARRRCGHIRRGNCPLARVKNGRRQLLAGI